MDAGGGDSAVQSHSMGGARGGERREGRRVSKMSLALGQPQT